MKPLFRRIIAWLTIAGGAILLYFEITRYEGADSWFWIAIAGLAIVLGMIDVFAKRPER